MGERVCEPLLPNRRAAVQLWLQVVVVQSAGFHRVRLDVPRIRRAEPAGVSKGGSDCDLYGLGHSPQLDRQGASPVRLSTSRETQNLHRWCPPMLLPTKVAFRKLRQRVSVSGVFSFFK